MEQDGNVYSCSSMTGAKFWCGLDDWKPGDTDDCQMAWTLMGSGEGMLNYNISQGCPAEFRVRCYLVSHMAK